MLFYKGNKEEYWLNYRVNGERGWVDKSSTTGALLYAYNALSERDLEFFAKQKPSQEIIFDQLPTILICHGSPYKVSEKMIPCDNKTIELINSVRVSLILCGHTHRQQKITHNKTSVLNPGSVGMPLSSEGKTQFLILQGFDNKWSEEFISLSYDVERVIHEIYESKLDVHAPYWSYITQHCLRTGLVSHGEILDRAMELCKEETGVCIWPDVPERYWSQAVGELLELKKCHV